MRLICGLLLALAMTAPAAAAETSISGEASYRERMLLPPGAVLEVRLEDQSIADAPAHLVARFEGPATTSPTAFAVTFDAALIEPGRRYGWRATLSADGRLLFTTDQFLPFEPEIVSGIDLRMVKVAALEPLAVAGNWLAEDIAGGGVIDNAQTTLEIGDGHVSGSGGCNRFSGTVELAGDRMTVGPLVSTETACAPALMDQESKFHAALARVQRFEIDTVQRKLMLFDAAENAIVVLSRMD